MVKTRSIVSFAFFSLFVNCCEGYGYGEDNGPLTWAADYPESCGRSAQSPIDIPTAAALTDHSLGRLQFTGYDAVLGAASCTLRNTGNHAEVELPGSIALGGGGLPGRYVAVSFHFHWGSDDSRGSEHTVDSRQYPMELHIVHYSDLYGSFEQASNHPQGLAVVSVLIQVGNENDAFNAVVDSLLDVSDPGATASIGGFALQGLLPDDTGSYWRYDGSLTTPYCNESVVWTIFRSTLNISQQQLSAFRSLRFSAIPSRPMENNFRPPQPLNGRPVYYSSAAKTQISTFISLLSLITVKLAFVSIK